MKAKIKFLVYGLLIISIYSCDGFFGEKTDLSQIIDVPKYDSSLISYVPVFPFIEGFSDPVQVLSGYDELIYVVDAGTDEIIAFDYAYKRLGSFKLKGVKAIAQDRRLNILAIADKDTVVGGIPMTLSAIYRLDLYDDNTGKYGIQHAKIINEIVHPLYFKTSLTANDTNVTFNSIAVYADNSYVVTRDGPDNNPVKYGGPDDAVLNFDKNDQWLGQVIVTTIEGEKRDYFRDPYGITTLAQPPQSVSINPSKDFIVTVLDKLTSLKVQYIKQTIGEQGPVYELRTDLIVGDTSRADGFLYTPNRFEAPVGVTYSGDGTNLIFVTDTIKDSVYVFTSTGLEGVTPPPFFPSTKYINVSFGGFGSGPMNFNNPTSVAYINKYLYVCDRGNKRISRFILTKDLD